MTDTSRGGMLLDDPGDLGDDQEEIPVKPRDAMECPRCSLRVEVREEKSHRMTDTSRGGMLLDDPGDLGDDQEEIPVKPRDAMECLRCSLRVKVKWWEEGELKDREVSLMGKEGSINEFLLKFMKGPLGDWCLFGGEERYLGGIEEVRNYCWMGKKPVIGVGPGKPLSRNQKKSMTEWLRSRRGIFGELLDALEMGRKEELIRNY